MTDIVERLRIEGAIHRKMASISVDEKQELHADAAQLADEAVAEILRLRSATEWKAIREECAKVADDRAERCLRYAASIVDGTLAKREQVAAAECRLVAVAIRALPPPPQQ